MSYSNLGMKYGKQQFIGLIIACLCLLCISVTGCASAPVEMSEISGKYVHYQEVEDEYTGDYKEVIQETLTLRNSGRFDYRDVEFAQQSEYGEYVLDRYSVTLSNPDGGIVDGKSFNLEVTSTGYDLVDDMGDTWKKEY